MYCPKCNKEVNDGSAFCNICGSRLVADLSYANNQKTDSVIDIQSLNKAYVGENYEKIRTKNFSLCYFFFGPYYAIYRKMYLLGIALLGLSLGLMYFDMNLYVIVMGIINIIIALNFNHIYMKYVDQVVDKIRKNNTGSREELLRICRYSGGVNITFVLVAFMIFGCVSFSLCKDKIMKVYDTYFPNNTSVFLKEDYKSLTVEIPKEFTKTNDSNGKVIYDYVKGKDNCNYTIEVMDSTNTSYNYLNRKTTYTARDTRNPIEKQIINKNEWDLLKVNTANGYLIYDYAIVYEHVLYNFTYKISKDSGVCTKLQEEVSSSLKLKKD